jgi:hypothetical protein
MEGPKCGDCSILDRELRLISSGNEPDFTITLIKKYTKMKPLVTITGEFSKVPIKIEVSGYDHEGKQIGVSKIRK